MKKLLSVLLCLLLTLSLFSVTAAAGDEAKTLKIVSYNVAGLPIDIDVFAKQADIGRYLNASDYDIVALQEDFTFHQYLDEQMTSYPYTTVHTGGIPGGDGLNVYSKNTIYNEYRAEWEKLSGIIDGGNDALTPKGFLYTVVELEGGVYLDFYVLHADAYGDAGSVAARTDNFRQLAEHINSRQTDRPVIVAGDYNAFLHLGKGNSDSGLYEYMIGGAGMKDGWVECHNNGDYADYSYYINKYGAGYTSTCGVWDSIERVMYKDGGGVHLEITKLEYDYITSEHGELSDHPALDLEFTYEKTADFVENSDPLSVKTEDKKESIFRRIFYLLKDIILVLTDWDKLTALLGGLF